MDTFQVKVTYIIIAIRQGVNNLIPYLLLDENKLPSMVLENTNIDGAEFVKTLHNKYLCYDFDFYKKNLAGVRANGNTLEVVYSVVVNYLSGTNKCGYFYTQEEISEKSILIEGFYNDIISRTGYYTR